MAIRKGGDFLVKFTITSKFHATESFRDHPHLGTDFAMPMKTPLYSVQDGIVSNVLTLQDKSSLGNAIFIKLKNGNEMVYGHLNSIKVKEGESVQTGELIGLSGNTGNSTGAHLHFGLKDVDGNWINPDVYVPLIQKMGETISKFSDNIQKLNAGDMLNRALEGMSDLTINFISLLFDDRIVSLTLHTISALLI